MIMARRASGPVSAGVQAQGPGPVSLRVYECTLPKMNAARLENRILKRVVKVLKKAISRHPQIPAIPTERNMAAKVTVDFDMLEDSAFVLADGLPMFTDVDFSLSRENSLSKSFRLEREPSRTFSRSRSFREELEICSMSRENSTSFIDNMDKVVLGRDNSADLSLTRENSGFLGFLARETSANLAAILSGTSSDISDVVDFVDHKGLKQEEKKVSSSAATVSPSGRRCDELLGMMDNLDQTSPRSGIVTKLGRGAPSKSRRGEHVKNRPDMQRTARDGAAHWAARVREVRSEWAERAARRPEFAARFGAQAAAAHGRVKAKQECLLRFLQLAADDGAVAPAEFGPGGFFGWRRFVVAAGRGDDFRRGLEGLFPAGFKEDTLKETFRRAGLLPERFRWEQGWRGGAAFEFRERAE
jgi:hypothetical protein